MAAAAGLRQILLAGLRQIVRAGMRFTIRARTIGLLLVIVRGFWGALLMPF